MCAWNGNVELNAWERREERDKAERDLLEEEEERYTRMENMEIFGYYKKVDAYRSNQKVNRSLDAC